FSTASKVESVLKDNLAPDLIAQINIQTLKDACAGKIKIGRGLVNMKEFHILWIQGALAKVGIPKWGPDLTKAQDSLFNSACRMSCISTFHKITAGGAFKYMNINLSFLNNISLLTHAYNYFVHYLMAEQCKKESKDPGSHAKDVKWQHVLKSREWVLTFQSIFRTVALPAKITWTRLLLSQTNAHSDDEKTLNGKAKIIKMLVYCSSAANKWFRLLDSKMEESEKLMGMKTQKTP
ncbi:hypothetical protein CROQUDRAFT_687004, partial [Cronartium quercuum f. sp. fusiforme G11]